MNAIEHEANAPAQFWSELVADKPYIHPADRRALDGKHIDLRRYGIQTGEVAQVELFPYHSKSFSDVPGSVQRLLLALPSVNVIRNWVHKTILPAAMSGKVVAVVQRRSKDWEIDDRHSSANVVVYKGGECQGGYVTSNTRGGRAIQRHLAAQQPDVKNQGLQGRSG